MTLQINTIATIGTGVIGASWAAFFASRGFSVNLYDLDAKQCQSGLERARSFIADLGRHALIDQGAVHPSQARLTGYQTLADALDGVDMVQESTAENYTVKKDLFHQMEDHLPAATILASSSSGLLMTEIQTVTRHPQRCLIAHPFNPPHLIPLVELVPGRQTAPATIDGMKTFFEDLGKTPVVLKKEAPGHIANRLAAALWREAIDIVHQGLASVEDVDKALCAGPGLRWALMGQHMIYHLGGGQGGMANFIDHLGPAVESWLKDMATWTHLPPETKAVLTQGVQAEMKGRSMEELMQWRDEKLIGLVKLLQTH